MTIRTPPNLRSLFFTQNLKKAFSEPGRPFIFATPTEKASEFLDHHLKPGMQISWSYIMDSGDFLRKIKQIRNFPENSIFVTTDVVGLRLIIPPELGLEALEKALQKSRSPLIKLAEFVLQHNYFEFNGGDKK